MLFLEDYEKRKESDPDEPEPEISMEEQFKIMKELLPDADPTYLQHHCERLHSPTELQTFISDAYEKRDYPTLKEYLRTQQLSAQLKQYTTEFSVEKFLEVIPDPEAFFAEAETKQGSTNNMYYCSTFLKNWFPLLSVRHITNIFSKNSYNMIRTWKVLQTDLKNTSLHLKAKRKSIPLTDLQLNSAENVLQIQQVRSIFSSIKKYLLKLLLLFRLLI